MCEISRKPSVQELWREKANCKCVRDHREPFSRSFGTNETQQLREGQLVGRMLLQRLATGATGVKQARYRRGPTRGSEALYAHAQYNTHLLFNGVMQFRRGFCTSVLSLLLWYDMRAILCTKYIGCLRWLGHQSNVVHGGKANRKVCNVRTPVIWKVLPSQ